MSTTTQRVGPVAAGIAKLFIIALFGWLGYALITALSGAVLQPFGRYADTVSWGLVVVYWVLGAHYVAFKADLNES